MMKPSNTKTAKVNDKSDDRLEVKRHFQLIRRGEDPLDMLLQDPITESSQLCFHVSRRAGERAQLFLHKGDSPEDPIYAAAVFSLFAQGYLHVGPPLANAPRKAGAEAGDNDEWWADPSSWISWDEGGLLSAPFNECALDEDTSIRWHRSIASQRRSSLSLVPQKRLVWRLTRQPREKNRKPAGLSATTANSGMNGGGPNANSTQDPQQPVLGPVLATLTSELPGHKPPKLGKSGREVEIGNLHWFETVDERTETLATMLVMVLWHRNRQVVKQEQLGPTVDIVDPRFKRYPGSVFVGAGYVANDILNKDGH